jgi:hypothetical protein
LDAEETSKRPAQRSLSGKQWHRSPQSSDDNEGLAVVSRGVMHDLKIRLQKVTLFPFRSLLG